ncbi:MAG: SusD/RagB family nutrient-binding outer membrane lipoprotein, partial [Paludibacter sp.]|nr:SusD/RagB family nutrient-binding outer membrane lipoprotein [Paludibacter sp.]
MKSIKIYFLLMLVALTSCSEDVMDGINKNPNDPTAVASRFILTDVMTSTAFSITGADYNFYASVFMELNVGTQGQMYNAEIRTGEPIASSTYNNVWNAQYRNLRQLQIVIDKCSSGGNEAGNWVNLGVARVLSAYNWAMLTDLMGDVPFTDALQPGVVYQPKIDKQEFIYGKVFNLLDSAIVNLGKTRTFPLMAGQDMIYKGTAASVGLWLKAAQGLKARYLMRLSHKSPKYAQVVTAVDASFANAAEELKYVYNGTTSVNPMHRFFTDRNNLSASTSLKEKLDARADPRAARFFKISASTQTAILFAPNGNPIQQQNVYGISNISSITAPTYLQSYHELQFIKAEALVRLGGAANLTLAQSALNLAVQAAFVKVGLTAAAGATYFTTSVLPLFTANPLS